MPETATVAPEEAAKTTVTPSREIYDEGPPPLSAEADRIKGAFDDLTREEDSFQETVRQRTYKNIGLLYGFMLRAIRDPEAFKRLLEGRGFIYKLTDLRKNPTLPVVKYVFAEEDNGKWVFRQRGRSDYQHVLRQLFKAGVKVDDVVDFINDFSFTPAGSDTSINRMQGMIEKDRREAGVQFDREKENRKICKSVSAFVREKRPNSKLTADLVQGLGLKKPVFDAFSLVLVHHNSDGSASVFEDEDLTAETVRSQVLRLKTPAEDWERSKAAEGDSQRVVFDPDIAGSLMAG